MEYYIILYLYFLIGWDKMRTIAHLWACSDIVNDMYENDVSIAVWKEPPLRLNRNVKK